MTPVIRPLALTTVLVLSLAVAAPAEARPARDLAPDAGSLELRNGAGTVIIYLARGAFYGSLGRGQMRITARAPANTNIVVWGAERRERINRRTTVYLGQNLRFRITGAGWRVRIQGVRIAGSAVGIGVAHVRGRSGRLSHNFGAFEAWPAEFRPMVLGRR